MENIGALAIMLAFCLAIYSVAASLVGAWKKKPFLIASGERAVIAVWALIMLATGILLYALVTSDFRYAYVAAHSNHDMPWYYKISSWWGGQEGSLLLWNFVLVWYAFVVVIQNKKRHRAMMPYVVATLMATQVFFLTLNVFPASPFQMLAQGRNIVEVQDGNGLNPLLQYWTMLI